MNKEQQNLAWAYLTKEMRDRLRTSYEQSPTTPISAVLICIYGKHNLTSDVEPEEILIAKKKDVLEFYKNIDDHIRLNPNDRIPFTGVKVHLRELFRDKCIPDPKNFNSGDKVRFKKDLKKYEGKIFTHVGWYDEVGGIANIEDEKERIIQAHISQLEHVDNLKFKVDDVVVYHPFKTNSFYNAKVLEIREGEDRPYLLHLNGAENIWAYPVEVQSIEETNLQEKSLKLSDVKNKIDEYFDTHSDKEVLETLEKYGAIETLELKVGDEVYIYPNKEEVFKIMRIQEGTGDCELKNSSGFKFGWINQKHLRLYNDMTEKELRLSELLRNSIGETFFSRSHGEIVLYRVIQESKNGYFLDFKFEEGVFLRFTSDGRRTKKGEIDLWPSRELYQKYPLSPIEAWEEWVGSGGKLKNEIESFLKSCTLPDDIDDRCYSAARSGILMGLELNAKYSEEEIKRILQ